MISFSLVSDMKPTGDQPQAIDALVNHLKKKDKDLVLIGVTGSGKISSCNEESGSLFIAIY